MDAVRRKESVIDALPEAVGVERIVKVAVGVAVIVSQRGCRHADLKCRLEILENLAPVAFIAGAPRWHSSTMMRSKKSLGYSR